MAVITILGGGSPYTLNLLSALSRNLPEHIVCSIRLYGRDATKLDLIARVSGAAITRSNWAVNGTTNLRRALEGADIVVHQIRYGGLEGRDEDELFAKELGVLPDETLGPCGLKAAIRVAPHIITLANLMSNCCPRAWLLNLTNPLSLSSAIFVHAGFKRTVGLCELPKVTHAQIAEVLGVAPRYLKWMYAGLNHRGFIHGLRIGNSDVFDDFLHALKGNAFNGIRHSEMQRLQAVPLKYWRLFCGSAVSKIGRAKTLIKLNAQILRDLNADPTKLPMSLCSRATPWYSEATVPLIRDLLNGATGEHVLTFCHASEEIATEHKVTLKHGELVSHRDGAIPAAVQESMRLLTRLEHASLRAALDPSWRNVKDALLADPMLPVETVDKATGRLTHI